MYRTNDSLFLGPMNWIGGAKHLQSNRIGYIRINHEGRRICSFHGTIAGAGLSGERP